MPQYLKRGLDASAIKAADAKVRHDEFRGRVRNPFRQSQIHIPIGPEHGRAGSGFVQSQN